MNIFVIGYMASGKTTFGKALAEELKVRFIDLDDYISTSEGKTIRELFRDNGEQGFRELERSRLREVVNQEGNKVIACGGGTPCFSDNMAFLNDNGVTIFLETSTPVLIRRLQEESESRPLIAGKTNDEIEEYVLNQLCERLPHYMEAKLKWHGDDLETQKEIDDNVSSFISSYPSIFR